MPREQDATRCRAAAAQAQMSATPATDIKFCAIDDPAAKPASERWCMWRHVRHIAMQLSNKISMQQRE
jgi:hypothetical protein